MKFAGFTLALAGLFAGSAIGQTPTVGGLLNNYSNTLPGLPNYGIAEGSIFDIYGTNFTTTAMAAPAPPLQPTLNGVSISVTVNGTTTHPLFYYLGTTQIDAVLPSSTPVGTGTITVTTSAGTSDPFPITVVASDFGLLTTNNGSGPAQGYDASIDSTNQYILFGYSEAVNPGDVLELWGTGLGPVTDDATGVAVTPTAQVFIGGVAATVQYAGRSSYPGLDQINVVVPSGVSGCYVSVVVQTGTYLSNFGTIPVAATGRTCSDSSNPLTSLLNGLSDTGTISIGLIGLTDITTPAIDGIGGGTKDNAYAAFFKITGSQINSGASAFGGATPSVNSCSVNFYNATSTTTTPPTFSFTYLNAGSAINMTGPDGALSLPLTSVEGIDIYTSPSTAGNFIPDAGGAFTFNNGSGGPDVGSFTAALNFTSPLTWTNMSTTSTISRQSGLTVTWTGGDPSTFVTIAGTSYGVIGNSTTDFVVGNFTCYADASAGTFTVPSTVLSSLPASTTEFGASTSTLEVSNVTAPATFTAPGIDLGLVEGIVTNTIYVTYQ